MPFKQIIIKGWHSYNDNYYRFCKIFNSLIEDGSGEEQVIVVEIKPSRLEPIVLIKLPIILSFYSVLTHYSGNSSRYSSKYY